MFIYVSLDIFGRVISNDQTMRLSISYTKNEQQSKNEECLLQWTDAKI